MALPRGELSAKLTEGVNGPAADPLRPAARPTSPWGEELPSHCSPKGELPAKPGEGVNGASADPLRPAARPTSPWGEELENRCSPEGERRAKPGGGAKASGAGGHSGGVFIPGNTRDSSYLTPETLRNATCFAAPQQAPYLRRDGVCFRPV